jgi:transposase
VSIASAVRWVTRYKTTGQISPSPSGGDRRSGRIEAQRDYLLGLIRRTFAWDRHSRSVLTASQPL